MYAIRSYYGYAKALVGLGAEQGMVERYGEELVSVKSVFTAETLLRLIVESPTFPIEKKAAILAELNEKLQLSDGIVITSYSIHYTKLYEKGTRKEPS